MVIKVPQTVRAYKAQIVNASGTSAVSLVAAATNDILAKLSLVGKDLGAFSLETVRMFRDDAVKAGFTLGRRRAAA